MDSLQSMLTSFQKADEIYKPSYFWQDINALHMRQIEEGGYENFKQTINFKYFGFVPSVASDQFLEVMRFWLAHPSIEIFKSKFEDYVPFDFGYKVDILTKYVPRGRITYKLFVSMLWEYTKHIDRYNILDTLEEPIEGNPFKIYYGGRLISQDLCNSVLEYYSIIDALPLWDKANLNIAELGAGYGRVAYVFLKAHRCKYTIFDIPPALYIAQRYLTAIFPELKVFGFRDFNSYDEIAEEYEHADISFFTPNQMVYLPKFQYNLFINISSLHEMTMPQIKNYIDLIDKYTVGSFYMKQWFKSTNREDGIVISCNDYPIPSEWERVYLRGCAIQKLFFEAMYKIG
jgi:putative sugar O-methyltransferase